MDDDDGEILQAHVAIKREEAAEAANEKKAAEEKTRGEEERILAEVVWRHFLIGWHSLGRQFQPSQ